MTQKFSYHFNVTEFHAHPVDFLIVLMPFASNQYQVAGNSIEKCLANGSPAVVNDLDPVRLFKTRHNFRCDLLR